MVTLFLIEKDDHSEDEESVGTTSKKITTKQRSLSTFYGDIEKMKVNLHV